MTICDQTNIYSILIFQLLLNRVCPVLSSSPFITLPSYEKAWDWQKVVKNWAEPVNPKWYSMPYCYIQQLQLKASFSKVAFVCRVDGDQSAGTEWWVIASIISLGAIYPFFLHLLNCLYLDPWVFPIFVFSDVSPTLLGKQRSIWMGAESTNHNQNYCNCHK